MRILIVDDEAELATLIARGLGAEGHDVVTAGDGIGALGVASRHRPEVAVVDIGLPGMSGIELCRRLQDQDDAPAIILLTARDAIDDRVRGLDSGADDYVTKPFALEELAARIRAVARRGSSSRVAIGDIELDLAAQRLRIAGRDVRLSRTEFDVMRALAARDGSTATRDELLAEVWRTAHIDSNILDQYVSQLRRKLAGSAARIVTERGVGFALRDVER